MERDMIWLKYLFRGFKFEFVEDHLIITDTVWQKKWKMILENSNSDMPFRFILLEKEQ